MPLLLLLVLLLWWLVSVMMPSLELAAGRVVWGSSGLALLLP